MACWNPPSSLLLLVRPTERPPPTKKRSAISNLFSLVIDVLQFQGPPSEWLADQLREIDDIDIHRGDLKPKASSLASTLSESAITLSVEVSTYSLQLTNSTLSAKIGEFRASVRGGSFGQKLATSASNESLAEGESAPPELPANFDHVAAKFFKLVEICQLSLETSGIRVAITSPTENIELGALKIRKIGAFLRLPATMEGSRHNLSSSHLELSLTAQELEGDHHLGKFVCASLHAALTIPRDAPQEEACSFTFTYIPPESCDGQIPNKSFPIQGEGGRCLGPVNYFPSHPSQFLALH